MSKVNTTKSITTDRELELDMSKLSKEFQEEKKVKVSIPKAFSRFDGDTLPVGLNGVFIVIPVDGKIYEIPESFAKIVEDYVMKYEL
ncbi:hypothetical protein ABNF65_02650 [Paenibacillus larvae]